MTTIPNIQKTRHIEAADFWCGAGGTSTGLVAAVESLGYKLSLTAVNHWDIAVATHSKNHPEARHLCKAVDSINPLDLYRGTKLHLLVASPECIHHSRARGGKPRDEQKRADVWDLKRWIEKLYIQNLLIENVREFVDWGPLGADGKPLKSKKGVYFREFINWLKILYKVEWRVLNCADYGDATTRERFFLIAKRGKNKKISFPEPTHASRKVLAKKQPNLFGTTELKPWRAAREIIDWTLPGKSIFGRKKPLSDNTMKRIFAGLFKYSLKPFVMGTGGRQLDPRSVDEPMRTIMTDHRFNLFEPYLINLKATNRRDRSIDEPCFTQCSANHQMLVEPFFFNMENNSSAKSEAAHAGYCYETGRPIPTIAGKGMFGLIEPYLVKFFGGQHSADLDNPIPTITANYEHYGLAQPYLIKYHGNEDGAHSVDDPLSTISTKDRLGVAEPFLIQFYGENNGQKPRTRSVDVPLWTVTPQIRMGIVEPFLVRFKNHQDGQSIDDPLKTITTKDSYGLCIPQLGAVLDIRFRMLQPHELAAAMSFPKTYHFAGNREQQVKQIGNAVPVRTAEALCKAILSN